MNTDNLGSACYAIRIVTPLMTENTLRMIYFAYVHSLLSYVILLWGNSPHSLSGFKMQKRKLRIMTKTGYKDLVDYFLRTGKFYHFTLNMYFL